MERPEQKIIRLIQEASSQVTKKKKRKATSTTSDLEGSNIIGDGNTLISVSMPAEISERFKKQEKHMCDTKRTQAAIACTALALAMFFAGRATV